MEIIEATLIKNTAKKEREMTVKNAIALGSIDNGPISERAKELFQQYIDGKLELHEIIEIRNAEFRAMLAAKESKAG